MSEIFDESEDEYPLMIDSDSDEFRICDQCFCDILSKTNGRIDLPSFAANELTVVLVWHICGLIGNAGMRECLENTIPGDPDYRLTLAQFDRIKMSNLSSSLKEYVETIQSGKLNQTGRKNVIKRMNAIEVQFESALPDIVRNLSAYVLENGLYFKKSPPG